MQAAQSHLVLLAELAERLSFGPTSNGIGKKQTEKTVKREKHVFSFLVKRFFVEKTESLEIFVKNSPFVGLSCQTNLSR